MHVLPVAACLMTVVCATDSFAQTVSLAPPDAYPTGNGAPSVVVGDFDNDGVLDVAAASPDTNPGVLLYRGDGAGGLLSPVFYPIAAADVLRAADLNADGNLDLHLSSGSVGQSALGDGSGGFLTPVLSQPADLIADFTGDGFPDLIATRPSPTCAQCDELNLHRGLGDGTFGSPEQIMLTDDFLVGFAAADFNNDGTLDLAFDNPVLRTLYIALNDGSGSFGLPDPEGFTQITSPRTATGDINNDGAVDIVLTNLDETISLFLGNGDGTLQPAQHFPTCTDGSCASQFGIAIADLNGDSFGDVVTTLTNEVSILPGRADGSLGAPLLFPAFDFPRDPILADMNADQRIDVIVATGDSTELAGTRSIYIYLNQTGAPGDPDPGTGDVTWTQLVGTTLDGSTLEKTAGCDGCFDAGATASPPLTADGSVAFTVVDPGRILAAGLGSPSTTSPAALPFALYVQGGGWVEVRENGAYRTDTPVAAGDRLSITIASGVVTYAKNDTPFYTSAGTPLPPLQFHALFAHIGASIGQVTIVRGSTPPPPPPGDEVTWPQTSNVTIEDGVIRKTGGCGGCFDAFALAGEVIYGGHGYVEFTIGDPSLLLIAGLSTGPGSAPSDIEYGLFIQGAGWAEVRENGVYRGDVAVAEGDVLRISIADGAVSYATNGVVFHVSESSVVDDLRFVAFMADFGAQLSDVTIQ